MSATLTDPHFARTVDDLPWISARRFGAKLNGVADDTEAMLKAYDSGYPISLGPGRLRVTSQFTSLLNDGGRSSFALRGAGPELTTIDFAHDGRVINLGDDDGSIVAIAEQLDIGERQVTCTGAVPTGLQAGDWVEIFDDLAFNGTTSVNGQMIQVLSVDSATDFTTMGGLEEQFLLANNPKVRRMPCNRALILQEFTLEFTAPATQNLQIEAIRAEKVGHLWLKNILGRYLENPFIKVSNCPGGLIEGIEWERGNNDDVNNRFPYGVLAFNATRHLQVRNCRAHQMRHLYTTGATTGRSVPKHCSVADCDADGFIGSSAFDTHPEGRWQTFSNNKATNCTSNAHSARSPDTVFINPQCVSTDRGVQLAAGADRSKVIGGDLRQISRQTTTVAQGVDVDANDCFVGGGLTIDTTEDEGIHWSGNDGRMGDVTVERTGRECVEVTGQRVDLGSQLRVYTPGTGAGPATGVLFNGAVEPGFQHIYAEGCTTGVSVNSTCTLVRAGRVTGRNNTADTSYNTTATYSVPPKFARTGSPEGAITAPAGSTCENLGGGAATSFYVKQTTTGNTGWAGK